MRLQLAFLIIMICPFTTLSAQDAPEKFKITVERNGREIRLMCTEGCLWKELSYSNDKSTQAINTSGMTTLRDTPDGFDDRKTGFLFTLAKTNDGLSLQGLWGTAWKALDFSLKNGRSAVINELGMMDGE